MTFTVDRSDPAVVAVSGDVLGGADAMEFTQAVAELVKTGARRVIVDVTDVRLMNSSGLGMLVAASTSVRSAQGRLVVAGANDKILALLKMTRLDGVFTNYQTRDEAVAACRQN